MGMNGHAQAARAAALICNFLAIGLTKNATLFFDPAKSHKTP